MKICHYSLQVAIDDLLLYFREEWPKESITPKLHILEKHVVPFIQKRRYGMGKYGEQGGEGIHSEFNSLTHPLAKKLKPEIKRRNKDN